MSRIKNVLQIVFLIAVAVFVALYLRDQWDQIREAQIEFDWRLLILSQIVMTLAWLSFPVAPALIRRALKIDLPRVAIWRIFYVASVAKYLPGGVWALPGQVFLYQREGIPIGRSVVLVFWEVLIKVVAAALVTLFALPVILHYLPAGWVFGGLALGLGALAAGWFIAPLRAEILRHAGRLPAFLTRPFSVREDRLTLTQFAAITLRYVGIWLLIGAAFVLMIWGITPDFPLNWSIQALGVAIGSWLAGFLFILSPGGIGVRDGLIILGFSVVLESPYPAVIAVAARISWTLAEATCLVGGLLAERLFRRDMLQSNTVAE